MKSYVIRFIVCLGFLFYVEVFFYDLKINKEIKFVSLNYFIIRI